MMSVIVGSRIKGSSGPRPNVSSITSLTSRSRSLRLSRSALWRQSSSAARRTSTRNSSSFIVPMAPRSMLVINCWCRSFLRCRNRSSAVINLPLGKLAGNCVRLIVGLTLSGKAMCGEQPQAPRKARLWSSESPPDYRNRETGLALPSRWPSPPGRGDRFFTLSPGSGWKAG